MKAFELQGTVTLNNQDANNKIDETSERMEALHTTLMNGMETVGKWALKFASSMAVAVTATKAALVKIVSDNTAAMDSIDKASKRVGMSTKSYQEWNYVLQQSGTSMGQMESGMMTLVKRMKEVQDGSETTKAWFDMLGVAATDDEGNLRDVAVVFEEIIAAMTVMKGDKMTTADFFFGGSGQQLQYLLDTSYADIVALKKEANDLGLILTDEQIAAGVEFVNTTKTLKSAYGTIGHDITTALLPALQQFYDFLIEKFPTIKNEFVNGFLPALKDVVSGVLGIIQALLDPDGEINLDESINRIVMGIASIAGRLAEHVPTLVDGLVKLFEALLPYVDDLVEALVPLVTAIFNGLMDKIPELAVAVGGAVGENADTFLGLVFGLTALKGSKKGFGKLIDWIRKAIYPDSPTKPTMPTPTEPTAPTAPTPTTPAAPPGTGMPIAGLGAAKWLATAGMKLFPLLAAPGLINAIVNFDEYNNKGKIFDESPAFQLKDGAKPPNYSPAQMVDMMRNYENNQTEAEDEAPQYMSDSPSVGTGDPLGVEYYRKEYGDNWFDLWYEKNKDTIDPEDLDYVLDKYDVPTFGNAMPGFGDGMMGALSAFFPGGKGFMGGDMTPLTTQLASLNAKLDTVINQQAQGKTIVLNTGALVGNIGGAMDKFLGNTVLNKTRTGGVNV